MAGELARIGKRIESHVGLSPPEWVLAVRVGERAARHHRDLAGYAELLESPAGAAELDALAEAMRVGETRFYRHPNQLRLLAERVIPDRLTSNDRVRAWSVGCASGEEAWTIAILLAEAGVSGWDNFEVLGTDLSESALSQARAGWYAMERLAYVPPESRARWLVRDGAGMRIAPQLREHVHFARHNLLDPRPGPSFDIVLCRNVLIYFNARREEALARMVGSLAPGGYLLLGNGETVRSGESMVEAVRGGDGLVYRRRTSPVSAVDAAPIRLEPERSGPWRDLLALPPHEERVVRLLGSYERGERLAQELRPVLLGGARVIDLDGVEFLDDDAARILGRLSEAVTGLAGLRLRATRPSVRRWIARHHLGDALIIEPPLETSAAAAPDETANSREHLGGEEP